MEKQFFVYMITNKIHSTLYVGMMSDLQKRIYQHKEKCLEGFSKTYNLNKLVFFEEASSAEEAIIREKQIKRWRREKKEHLIEKINPQWIDLYQSLF